MSAQNKRFNWAYLADNWKIVLPVALGVLLVLQLAGVDLVKLFIIAVAIGVFYLLNKRILRVFPKGKKRIAIHIGSLKVTLTRKQIYIGLIGLIAAWIILSIIGKIITALIVLGIGFFLIAGGASLGQKLLPSDDG